jgi:C-terminal processing protease CtpA/Prc
MMKKNNPKDLQKIIDQAQKELDKMEEEYYKDYETADYSGDYHYDLTAPDIKNMVMDADDEMLEFMRDQAIAEIRRRKLKKL